MLEIISILQLRRLTGITNHSVLEEKLKMKCDEKFEIYGLVFPNKHVRSFVINLFSLNLYTFTIRL